MKEKASSEKICNNCVSSEYKELEDKIKLICNHIPSDYESYYHTGDLSSNLDGCWEFDCVPSSSLVVPIDFFCKDFEKRITNDLPHKHTL
jgi:hypothetical protein